MSLLYVCCELTGQFESKWRLFLVSIDVSRCFVLYLFHVASLLNST